MAISKKPTDYIEGYELVAAAGTVTAQSAVFPLADLSIVSATEANATTGDIREISRGINETLFQAIQALPVEDRPTKFKIEKSDVIDPTDKTKQTITYKMTYNIKTDPSLATMQDE